MGAVRFKPVSQQQHHSRIKSLIMVSKLVIAVVVPIALVFAAGPPHHPVHPVHPAPHHPPHGHPPHGYCDPKAPPKCAVHSDLPFCIEDPEYPEYEIANKISQDPIFLKKYSDVPDQSADDLVEHIAKQQEEGFDYSYYTGASKGPSPYDATHWIGPEGYLCPSDVKYAMPKRARNVNGEGRGLVNDVHYYTQTARMETCLTPDSACR